MLALQSIICLENKMEKEERPWGHYVVTDQGNRYKVKKSHYHFLHDQYRADILSVAVSQLCRARKLFRLAGSLFLIFILASPNRMIFSLPSLHALTTNFFPPWTWRLGELHFILDLSIAITLPSAVVAFVQAAFAALPVEPVRLAGLAPMESSQSVSGNPQHPSA